VYTEVAQLISEFCLNISTGKQSQKYHTQTFDIIYVTPEPCLNRQEEMNISNEPKPVLKMSMERSREVFFCSVLMAEHHGVMVYSVTHKTFSCYSPVSADMLILTSTDTRSNLRTRPVFKHL